MSPSGPRVYLGGGSWIVSGPVIDGAIKGEVGAGGGAGAAAAVAPGVPGAPVPERRLRAVVPLAVAALPAAVLRAAAQPAPGRAGRPMHGHRRG